MAEEHDWPLNYYNYFTEIEEHFQRARGTGLFLLSPIDWALIETWKNEGIPLEAVLRGIDTAFEKWHAKKKKVQAVNSLSYCAQAVEAEAAEMAGAGPAKTEKKAVEAPFSVEELAGYLQENARSLQQKPEAAYREIGDSLAALAADAATWLADLEQLEARLTALEEKMTGYARSKQTDEDLFRARQEMERQLKPHRGKMSAPQLKMLEQQYLDRRLLEDEGLRRLSLFYL